MGDKRWSVARHGIAYRFNGFPIFGEDAWPDETPIIGFMYEPPWREDELTQRHVAEVDALVAEWLAERPEDDPLTARYSILEHNGVEHAHRRGKLLLDRRPAYGYECAMCGSAIIARDPGDAPFYGGPFDGRWVITGGAQIWRVPIPATISLAPDDPNPTAAFPMVEYQRGRDGAYYIDRQSYPK